ncbi:MAG: four helix bundle protein [Chloroflexia bacterium]
MAVEEFEDLVAWRKARALTKAIYQASSQGRFAKDYGLAGQIQRASVSIMSNVAEGFERGSRAEFAQFLSVAKGSCSELRSQIYVALDNEYISEEAFSLLMAQAKEVGRIVGGLRAAVAKQRDEQREKR